MLITYSLDVLLSRFWTSLFFHVWFQLLLLPWIQVSQEAGRVVWYSHLFKSFPQFVVIHTFKCFSLVSEAERDVFLEFLCFFCDPTDIFNLISGSAAFSKSTLYIWKFLVHILLKPSLKDFDHYLASVWNEYSLFACYTLFM